MWNFFPLAMNANITWYLLPLAVAVSLAYSASRVEDPQAIVKRAGRLLITILFFMGLVLAGLVLLSRNL